MQQQLRQAGFSVELDLSGSAFKKQFARADKSGTVACLILGDEEAANQTVKLKWMATKEQTAIAQTELLATTDRLRADIQSYRTER